MPIWSLTQERLDRLNEQIRKKKEEHDALDVLSEKDLWCEDLDQFTAEWDAQSKLDAEIQTNIRRMGRRVSKKIGAGKARKARDDDDYAPSKKGKPTKANVGESRKEKMAQRFAEAFTAEATPPPIKSEDNTAFDNFTDDDLAALGRKKKPAQGGGSSVEATATSDGGKRKRAAASQAKTWTLSDDEGSGSDADVMLDDVDQLVKGIGSEKHGGTPAGLSRRLTLISSRPASSGITRSGEDVAATVPEPKAKSATDFVFDSDDDTDHELLARSSPNKATATWKPLGRIVGTAPKGAFTSQASLASSAAAPPKGIGAKSYARPVGSKPEAKAMAANAASSSTTALSPAAKADGAKKNARKSAKNEEMDTDFQDSDPPPSRPRARNRPGRAAASKARPIVLDEDDSDEQQGSDPFEMDESD